jgi:hypothetical protein
VEGLAGVGEFYTLDDPGTRVRGRFTAEAGKKAELVLDEGLVDDPRVAPAPGGGLALGGSAAEDVAAFRPITLQGRLETGEFVTLLGARNNGGDGLFGFPRYLSYTAVLGAALVNGDNQLYTAVRFKVNAPEWLAHLAEGESNLVKDDGSTLRVEATEDENWLVYESAVAAALRHLEKRAISACVTLTRLMLDKDVVEIAVQVRTGPSDPWLAVWRPGHGAADVDIDEDPLLSRELLTVERFADWIALNDNLDGLAWPVARPLNGFLQTQVVEVTSLVEGLHRRLPYPQSRFAADQKPALTRIRAAAVEAATAQAQADGGLDPALIHDLVEQATNHVGDVSFRERASVIVGEVSAAVPEIVESIADLPGRITIARNDIAHHLKLKVKKEPLADHYARWMVVTTITPWLLRALLLKHAGIEPDALHDGYMAHESFLFSKANVADFVSELGWQLPTPAKVCPRCEHADETKKL